MAAKLDILAAYDSVWLDGLLYKMAQIGIAGKTAYWIANWINSRHFQVKWRGIFSQPFPSFRGVPQGSVLSPILFMIFLWDIFDAVDSGVRIIVYADDVILYVSDQHLDRARCKLQDILDRVYNWCRYWKLDIQPDKCAVISFSWSNDSPPFTLKLRGVDLPWSDSLKILGVFFY